MYLKRIEIQGFKSFADKTEIEFKKDITAIVGPNGSGKSNISDAIRWVLGEQSAKNLRGSKMEDIIFSGTSKRKPLGFAEVSIFFDNKDKHIPVDYSEVVVTRRMFRSGESEFYINKNSCRLKDIRELFMDTGIGKDGYSIIGQGRIDEILSDRPEDRRGIFEEAAGIVKYKSKKEATEKKLADTEGNLVRIRDLFHEISKQKESLEVEANKAKEFTVLYDELKILEVNKYIRDIRKLKDEIRDINLDVEKDTLEIENIEKSKVEIEENFNELKNKVSEIENKIEESRSDKFNLIQSLEKDKNQINLLWEKENFYKKDNDRLKKEIEELNEALKELDEKINSIESEKTSINKNYETISKDFKLKNEELIDINKILDKKEEKLEEEKNKVITIYNEISDKKSQLNSIESFNENIDKRLFQLKKEIDNIDKNKKEVENKLQSLNNEEEDSKEYLEKLYMEKSKYKSKEASLKKKLDDISEDTRSIQIKLEGIISSYKLYKNMEEGYEGYYKSVKNLLNSIKTSKVSSKGYIGVVAELLKVDEIYEKAIDISLGSSLQNIVTETENDAKNLINFLKSNNMGRVTFLPLNSIKGNPLKIDVDALKDQGVLGLGHDLVKYDSKYKRLFEYLLGRTIIVDNIDNGIKLANRFNHRYRIVTLDGDVLNPGGSLTGGSYNSNALSLISRKNKINQLSDEINNYKNKIHKLENDKIEITNEYNLNYELLNDIDVKIKDIEVKILHWRSEKEALLREKDRLNKEYRRNTQDMESLEMEVSGFGTKKSQYLEELKELDEKSLEIKKSIELLNKDINEQKILRDKIQKEVLDLRLNLNNVENKLNNLNEELNSSIIEKENSLSSLEDKKSMIETIDKELNLILEERTKLNEDIKAKEAEVEKVSKVLEELICEKDNLMESFYEEQNVLKEINEKLGLLERNRNKKDLKLSKCILEYENKNTKLLEDYELEYEEALKFEDESIDIIKSGPRIKKLKASIKKLGNINLGAIEDYKVVKERADFLEKQANDLVKSKENLRKIINDMEKKMKDNFIESFNEINKNFSKVFSKLFNGGVATLELDSNEDILKSGIEIKVQPPGKRLQNINLLSGGEKSLTAVALLFAILELKPAPFCILDEIDAALDDANIGRYTAYLKKFNSDTQFILITHRKPTMEISDVLYGVTMVEEGISKLFSVELKDYVDNLVS